MKIFSKICTALIAAALVLSFGVTAYAKGTVTYDGRANEFIFAPGTAESPTNLFENFQNVMPGDTITEEISIKNDSSKRIKIKVYMRSLGAQENTDDFLSQLKLTVKEKDETILFDAPADETAQLTDWVYLGTVYSGGETTLDVTLEVPVTLGAEYMGSVGYIDWEFKVDEIPIDPSDPLPPDTGDISQLYTYISLFIISLMVLIVLLVIVKRKNQKNNG